MKYAGSWGGTSPAKSRVHPSHWRHEPFPHLAENETALPYGLGRSYGDSCLNDGGTLLLTRGWDRFIHFDSESGLLQCEAGVTLGEILAVIVPKGFFLPVVPGTQQVTVGGAIANDIHGKNHHRAGTFGRFVRRFELLRSDHRRLVCSPVENRDWFQATIGGLGLTGAILWAELELSRVPSPWIEQDIHLLHSLPELIERLREADETFEFTAAWLDHFSVQGSEVSGVLFSGNFSDGPPLSTQQTRSLTVPFSAPNWLLNSATARAFNLAYRLAQQSKPFRSKLLYEPFFFPLDVAESWNRLYGKRGFFQYQCVLPKDPSGTLAMEFLRRSRTQRDTSYLVVFKGFGSLRSPGLLSFPRPGFTIALDYPNRGSSTLQLFDELDRFVMEVGGAVYPAKDARMSPQAFRAFFPDWEKLIPWIDPKISSSFWRRVTAA